MRDIKVFVLYEQWLLLLGPIIHATSLYDTVNVEFVAQTLVKIFVCPKCA